MSVLDYLREREYVDEYLIGSLGFGVGGTCSLILAMKSKYLRACYTLWSEVPSFETLQIEKFRAAISLVQLANNQASADRLSLLSDVWWKAIRTARGRLGQCAVIAGVTKHFLNDDSSEYNRKNAIATWSSILLFFNQELLIDRTTLPNDQVGNQFSKLSRREKEIYLARMKNDPSFAKEVVWGFYATVCSQFDEDKSIFEAFKSDPELAKERGRVAAANFARYSEKEKQSFLEEVR